MSPEEGAAVRDALRDRGDAASQRLAEVIESAVSLLLASPLHAGTRCVRVADDELPSLLEVLHVLEESFLDHYAKARLELAG